MPVPRPTPTTRWRCSACGNLTRFDLTRSSTVVEYLHVDLAGDAVIEETVVLDEQWRQVRCRWCDAVDSVRLVPRNDVEAQVTGRTVEEAARAEDGSGGADAVTGSGHDAPDGEQQGRVVVLPEGARRVVLAQAAACLDAAAPAEVPASLRRVRAFAPARRATAGAVPLATALENDPAFRQRVAAAWREDHPELAAAVEDGDVPAATPPEQLAVAAFLLRPAGWTRLLGDAALVGADEDRRRREAEQAVRREARLDAVLARVAQMEEELTQAAAVTAGLNEELDGVRRELRRHRADADRARAAARSAEESLSAAVAERDAARALAADSDARLAGAAELSRARQEAQRRDDRRRQDLDDVRARLLLDTLVDAASALRRELALPPVERSPASLVVEGSAGVVEAGAVTPGPTPLATSRGTGAEDPRLLDQLLRMPHVHLVVDGYNVTKTAHPDRPLSEQRRWLVHALAGVAARTGAEVTCCFDGAAVQQQPGTIAKGVRVLFSGAGTSADELVRRLVRAEPAGRPVVVVSSDREVAAGVTAHGAWSVASAALVRFTGR